MDDLEGPRVFVTRENTADSGGGRLELRSNRLCVAGRLRARDLGPASELVSVEFVDRKAAKLHFTGGMVWIVRAEAGGLLEFARALESTIGREDMVRAPKALADLRSAATPETRREVGIFFIVLSLACTAMLSAIMWRDAARQRQREAAIAARAADIQRQRQQAEQRVVARSNVEADALAAKLKAAMDANKWEQAQTHHAALAALQGSHPMLAPTMATLQPQLDRIAEEERKAALKAGIRATRRALADEVVCDDPQGVSHAWHGLRRARPQDPEWDAAATLARALERCRRLVVKQTIDNAAALRHDQRGRFAITLPDRLRTDGHAAVVKLSGARDTALTVEIAGLDRAHAKEIAGKQGPDGALLLEAERLGFRKLTFTDGERNFPFPLTPKGEEENVQAILKTLGLDAPLNLTVPDPAP